MKEVGINLNIVATLFFILIIFVAQQAAPETYHWTQNTVSELASQGYKNKWIMQLGFIGFGILLTITATMNLNKKVLSWLREIPLAVYALCILFSGVFCTAPFLDTISYSQREAQLHSIGATVAGIAFSAALIAHMFTDSSMTRKWIHLATLLFVIGISLFFGMSSTNEGIIQRLLYSVSFIWLIFIYNSALFTANPTRQPD